ncbi:MAG TPA: hypothetical protein VND45_00355, partial [Thermoanaerobaculia bacterium]|nr:hypothetical protein [Thermoanaerobaculia bacterium]
MKKALLAVIVFALPLFAAGKFETHGGAGGAASRYRVSVQLDPTDDLASAAAQLAATYGARLESVDGSTTFVVTASEANARLLSADRRVSFVGDADPSLPIGVGSPYAGFGTYTYDGAGNITSVGDHTFTYDPYQRIRTATLGAGTGRSASYTYDQYGNIRTIVTDGNGADTMTLPVDTATNRLTSTGGNVSADYDAAGNLTSYNSGAMTFAYDALDMVQEATVNGTRRLHLYSATNERIATVQMVGNTPSRWDWTIRDASGKVLRRFS